MKYIVYKGKILAKIVPTKFDIRPDDYEYMLAVASDTMIVINREMEPLEFIYQGIDLDLVVFAFNDEDDLLDTINICKNYIKAGINPARRLTMR